MAFALLLLTIFLILRYFELDEKSKVTISYMMFETILLWKGKSAPTIEKLLGKSCRRKGASNLSRERKSPEEEA